MPQNGRFANQDLAAIPGGRLAKEAAANWLALRAEGGKRLGIWIAPLGSRSSYRTFAEQQHFWNLFQAGKGNSAARPGTSNHGWGNAVDLADPPSMRRVIDRLGAPYGWHWGEAPVPTTSRSRGSSTTMTTIRATRTRRRSPSKTTTSREEGRWPESRH